MAPKKPRAVRPTKKEERLAAFRAKNARVCAFASDDNPHPAQGGDPWCVLCGTMNEDAIAKAKEATAKVVRGARKGDVTGAVASVFRDIITR